MTGATSRRTLIGSSAAMLVACAFEAGATKAKELDSDIINASSDFIAVEAELDRLIDGMDAMSEREMNEADVQIRILRDRQKALEVVMTTTPAKTPEGLRAKAAATRAWIKPNQTGTAPCDEDDALAWSLCSDLLGRA